jgi:electron transfer flavoprotein alpha subunit
MSNIIVLAEQQGGTVASATYNAIGAARQLDALVGGGFDIVVAGSGIDEAARSLAGYGAGVIYQVEDPVLAQYTAQAYAQGLHAGVVASGARFVVSAASAIGKDCTPRVAARLEAGQASDIVGMENGPDGLVYTRPMYAGNILGKVKINTDQQVMTIRSANFDAAQSVGGESGIERLSPGIDAGSIRMRYVGLDAVESDRPSLSDADVVVSGGRGLKGKENFNLIEGLADQLNAAIGASRAVVDAGWAPNDWQVGQTGKVVAPGLYIAVGISGQIQHLAGMKGSKVIVAINKDSEAPIFNVADYGLVADLFEVVPELTEKLAAR